MIENVLKKEIQEIEKRNDLNEKEKSLLKQKIMMKKWLAKKEDLKEEKQTFNTNNEFGCSHYMIGCQLYSECCQRFYPCRLCHDEKEIHKMEYKKTKKVRCMNCFLEQEIKQECEECGQCFGVYYCQVCKLLDNNKNKNIYHCKECEICRIGPQEQFKHCNVCKACLEISFFENHVCVENWLLTNCPICGEDLFSSRQQVLTTKCNHPIHFRCYEQYKQTAYQCPICCKSLFDMSSYFNQIDEMLSKSEMPQEYQNTISLILCNDCETKSHVPYHFVYHKCTNCGSYNTKIIEKKEEVLDEEITFSDEN